MIKKIAGIGNALVDILVRLENDDVLKEFELPKGSMQLVDKNTSGHVLKRVDALYKQLASGGSASNTIHGLAKLGVQTAFIGTIGKDAYGDFFIKDMMNAGIEPILSNGNEDTGCAISLISPDSERTFATYLGAAIELGKDDVVDGIFKNYGLLHVEGYLVANKELLRKVAEQAKKDNCLISLDLASYNVVGDNIDFLQDFISQHVDILFANEEEAKVYTGELPEQALDIMAKQCDVAVVKIGKEGSFVKRGNNKYKVNAIHANNIDTTGAGDLYASGFLYGLMEKLPLDECGRIGSLLSGKVVEVIGPKLDHKSWGLLKNQI